jgi:hypothetical protein
LISVVGLVVIAVAITGAGTALAASQPSAQTRANAKQGSVSLTFECDPGFISRSACSGGSNSATCRVVGVTRTGSASLASDGDGYCTLLTTGGIDCWGWGYYGELGNGQFYTTGYEGSAFPVRVVGVGGTDT